MWWLSFSLTVVVGIVRLDDGRGEASSDGALYPVGVVAVESVETPQRQRALFGRVEFVGRYGA